MAIEEFARLFYTMSRILEDATETLKVSKRAGIALQLLAKSPGGSLPNSSLVNRFSSWHLSKTPAGAARDVSKATDELLKQGWISIQRGPYRVSITPNGQMASTALNEGIGKAMAQLTIPEERALLESLMRDIHRRKPAAQETTPPHPSEDASSG